MTSFNFGKGTDDIQQPELLPDDWYVCRIVKPPKLQPNKKKKAGMSEDEGARDNLVINLRVVHDNPSFNGRPFTKWLPVPNSTDSERYDEFSGMKMDDRLLDVVFKWATAFNEGKAPEGEEIDFNPGDEALVYIVQQYDGREGMEDDIVNSIDMNALPRAIE